MSVFEGLSIPRVIYKTHSDINGDIEVLQEGNTRRLRVNNVTQSINFDSPLAQQMCWGWMVEIIKGEQPDLKSILILGLGGGTVQHLVAAEFPGVYIVSVDIDPVMVDVASKYFNVDKIPNHKILIEDACRIIVEPEEFELGFRSFNAVVVDIYCGMDYPELGKSGNFLSHVAKMTMKEGLVMINRVYLEDYQRDVDIFVDQVENFLRDVKTVVVPGKTNADNMLIYGKVS